MQGQALGNAVTAMRLGMLITSFIALLVDYLIWGAGLLALIFIGIIGEYIGAIWTQVKNKPLVIEEERINFGE